MKTFTWLSDGYNPIDNFLCKKYSIKQNLHKALTIISSLLKLMVKIDTISKEQQGSLTSLELHILYRDVTLGEVFDGK